MKINKLPKDTTAKNDGEIIYSEDGQHLTRISRQDFLKGYGGGGKGGDGGLQYFQETEHALTGSVIYNGLSDQTLDETIYNVKYEHEWSTGMDQPYQSLEWGRINGVVSGTGYSYGAFCGHAPIYDPNYETWMGGSFPRIDGFGEYHEGTAPTEDEWHQAFTGETPGNFKQYTLTSLGCLFKKTNPGVTYIFNVWLPPTWGDYEAGSKHSNWQSSGTDWKLVTVMACETETPTYEIYSCKNWHDGNTRSGVVDAPLPPQYPAGDGSDSAAFLQALSAYVADEDEELSELLDELSGYPDHSSGRYQDVRYGLCPPYDGHFVKFLSADNYDWHNDPIESARPRTESQIGALTSPVSYYDISDPGKFQLLASGSGANVISDMNWPANLAQTITYRGKTYHMAYAYNKYFFEDRVVSFGEPSYNNFGDTTTFAIPQPYYLPYRGGRYKTNGDYAHFAFGLGSLSDPEVDEQKDFGAFKIIVAAMESVIPTGYYSGIKRQDPTALFVGAVNANGDNPTGSVDIFGNSNFNGGGSGGGGGGGTLIDVQVDGVSKVNGDTAYVQTGSGELQRYLWREQRTTWDSTNLRWNTELVALPDVGDNSGDKYIPVPDVEVLYLGNWGGGFYNSGTGELLLGQYQWRGINGQGQSYNSTDDIKVKLGNRLLFDNTTRVLSVDDTGIIDGAEDIPVDDYWIRAIPQQGGGYELEFMAQFDSSYFDVQRSSSTPYHPYITLKNAARPKTYTAGTGIDVNGLVISVNDDNGAITNMPTFLQNTSTNQTIYPKGTTGTIYSIGAIYPNVQQYSLIGVWHIDAIVKIPTNQYVPTRDNEFIDIWLMKNPGGASGDYESESIMSLYEKPRTRIMVRDYEDDDYIVAHVSGTIASDQNSPLWVCASHNTNIGASTPGTPVNITGVESFVRAYKLNTNGANYIVYPTSAT